MQEALTPTQRRVLEHLTEVVREEGRPPTLREICRHFGWRSDNAARQHLKQLEEKGYIEHAPQLSRGLRLTQHGPGVQAREAPLVGRVAAGAPIEAVENFERAVAIDAELFPEDDIIVLRVRGDSMIGIGIRDNDLAIVRRTPTAREGEVVVAMVDGETTAKRFFRRDDKVVLHAENPDYADLVLGEEDAPEIIGIVIGIMRRID